jgi:hypothetical protein
MEVNEHQLIAFYYCFRAYNLFGSVNKILKLYTPDTIEKVKALPKDFSHWRFKVLYQYCSTLKNNLLYPKFEEEAIWFVNEYEVKEDRYTAYKVAKMNLKLADNSSLLNSIQYSLAWIEKAEKIQAAHFPKVG